MKRLAQPANEDASPELTKVRAEAARVHEEWRKAKEALDPKLAFINERGEQSSESLKIEIDQYNSLVQIDSGLQHRVAELERREGELIKFSDETSITTEFEERAFWFRRFHTSLAIAHGAAFAAIGSHLFDKDITAILEKRHQCLWLHLQSAGDSDELDHVETTLSTLNF